MRVQRLNLLTWQNKKIISRGLVARRHPSFDISRPMNKMSDILWKTYSSAFDAYIRQRTSPAFYMQRTLQWRHNERHGVSNHLKIVHSTADQRKHQSSASLAFVRGIHRWLVNFPHKWPVKRKLFPLDDVIMKSTRDVAPLRTRWINVLYANKRYNGTCRERLLNIVFLSR